jgi:iron complex outermembrane receptor protein
MTTRLFAALLTLSVTAPATAQDRSDTRGNPCDLTEMSIEELMNVEVTSVSKKPEPLSQAPAAVYVLTGDDIRRSGATTIADALRLVPGVNVARLDSNKWAISTRGFSDRFSNKLLVLVDGRSVYTPLYSGVYWEVQDVPLEDIERIEVVRGPGGTLWGANAVNGVINIITKSAKDTQGGLITAGGGTEERLFGTVRYGGRVGQNLFYRIYAKAFDRDGSVDSTGADTDDDWSIRRTGFRIDWTPSGDDALTVHGDLYDGEAEQTVLLPFPAFPYSTLVADHIAMGGGNLVLRWEHTGSDSSDTALQLYYDRAERREAMYDYRRNTVDLDFQRRKPAGDRHEIIWGLGYRVVADHLPSQGFADITTQETHTSSLFSAFAQDEIALAPDRLIFTIGSKFEHNDYTGFEVQPSARLAWMPRPRQTLWMAVSRAVRTPSRGEALANGTLPGDPSLGYLARGIGTDDFESEGLLAFELGYRVQPSKWLSLDAAAFHNEYDKLLTWEAGTPFLETSPAPPHLILPMFSDNNAGAESNGIEVAANCMVHDWWRVRAGYSYLEVSAHLDEGSTDPWAVADATGLPQHTAFVHSMMDLGRNFELDLAGRYVDNTRIPWAVVSNYVELDARLAWRPVRNLELFLVGQNLLEGHHPEAVPEMQATQISEVERGVYVGITWRF